MIRDWVPTLFQERPLVYTCWMAGRCYGTQWTIPRDASKPGTYAFELLLEINPSEIGMGGSPLKQRSRLEVDEFLRPLSYMADANGNRWRLEFSERDVTITLRDEMVKEVPRSDAEFAFDQNMPGQIALVMAELAASARLDRVLSLQLFDVKQFAAVPSRMTSKVSGDSRRVVTTSHHEEILLDNVVMQKYALPKQSIEARLEPQGPPLPEWQNHDSLAGNWPKYRPPERRTFSLKDVTIPGPVTAIGGTLTRPANPIAAALFLAGSGTHDRHGIAGELDLGTHEIMDHLAEYGVLGLRVDSRGAGSTQLGADALQLGPESLLADGRACLDFLRGGLKDEELPIFLIGHSQGGTLALIIANETVAAIAGVLLMAVPGRRIDELIADQLEVHGRRNGLNDYQILRQKRELDELVRVIEEDRPWESDSVPDYLFGAVRTRHWFKQQLKQLPVEFIRTLRCPVLICQGGKDFQVSAERDARRLVDAARSAGIDYTYAFFPDLDHLFKMTSAESTVQSYFKADRRVDNEFLNFITDWIRSHAAAHS